MKQRRNGRKREKEKNETMIGSMHKKEKVKIVRMKRGLKERKFKSPPSGIFFEKQAANLETRN